MAQSKTCGTTLSWRTIWISRPASMMLAVGLVMASTSRSEAESGICAAARPAAIEPSNPALCASLEVVVREPAALPLAEYQAKLDVYLGNYCHRNAGAGWRRDKTVRDTGPFSAILASGKWQGNDFGTHGAVVIWYSPEMASWMTANRPGNGAGPGDPPPVPDGAVMVKEMFPSPADDCADIAPEKLFPTSGAAIMVRDRAASHDGWYWGWYGFGKASGWAPDWPPAPSNPLPNQGFALYCMNSDVRCQGVQHSC